MTIFPNMMKSDDDASSGAYGSVVADSGSDPFETTSSGPWIMGIRLAQGSSEGYIYLPKPAEGQKATAIHVGLIDKNSSSAKDEDIAVVSRSHVFSGGSGTSDYLTRHLALTSGNGGTNGEIIFTTAFVPTATNYMVYYMNISSNTSVLVGGYVKTVRV